MRRYCIWEDKKDGSLYFQISVGKLIKTFKTLDIEFGDPPIPPKWCIADVKLFGAYLAGVIDGDGSIRKTGGKVRIKITSGHNQLELKEAIKNLLNCWVGIYHYEKTRFVKGRITTGSYYELEFDVRLKTLTFFRECLTPKLEIKRKKERLTQFIDEKYGPEAGISDFSFEPASRDPQSPTLPS